MVRTRTPSGSSEINIPQVEVILTHSLVCRKTRREFIVSSDPDASFVANLAKHIRQMQPGTQMAKANSLLCIFCNSPYTYEDYLRHIQPSMDTILVSCNFFFFDCEAYYRVSHSKEGKVILLFTKKWIGFFTYHPNEGAQHQKKLKTDELGINEPIT